MGSGAKWEEGKKMDEIGSLIMANTSYRMVLIRGESGWEVHGDSVLSLQLFCQSKSILSKKFTLEKPQNMYVTSGSAMC